MFNSKIKTIQIVFMFTILCLSHSVSADDLAGKVVFVRGTPTAVDAANAVRALAKGSEVFSGDKLVSGNGRIQVSMIDGAFVSVQPESEFMIETFKYSGTADGTENAAMRLVKGGVRAVTGVIGQQNPEAYKVHTSVATIGIRGTGYNTRLCAGDCQDRTDGLYHNTWEGTTYVANNVESRDVPSRNGVYVRDINAPIEVLAQVAGVTAIDEGEAIAEEERKEEDTSTVVASGDQRNDQGLPVAIIGNAVGSAKVLTGMVGEHINHSDEGGVDAGGLHDMTMFFNAAGQPVGLLFSEDEDNGGTSRGLVSIDLNAVLAGNDPAAIAEVRSLLARNDPNRIAAMRTNPAHVEDFNMVDSVGYFRWTGGNLLFVGDDIQGDEDNGLFLTGNQSIHLIFGPQYTSGFPVSGNATYNFFGGTRSTSISGATIGSGVTGGNLAVNFATSAATLNMNVTHIRNYAVSGTVSVTRDGGLGLQDVNMTASTTGPGTVCAPACPAKLEGGFPGVLSGGVPVYAGFGYAIKETDEIVGAAVFKR